MKQIVLINGNPKVESYTHALADAYAEGAAAAGATVHRIDIACLDFDPNLKWGYGKAMELEPDLEKALQHIQAATHQVWVYPMWWHSCPALMKGFIDRIFLPGVAFKFQEGKPFPKRLWEGKTARIIVTADTPSWYNNWIMGKPAIRQFKKGTLEFCGVKPVKVTYLAPVRGSTDTKRQQWLDQVKGLGRQLH